jgi:hypothetical protein
MSGYYNDVMMQQEHRQDLLNEAHLDRVAREARGGRRSRAGELASSLIIRLSCLMINFGTGVREDSQHSQRSFSSIGTVLMSWGLRLNGLVAAGPDPCECCV